MKKFFTIVFTLLTFWTAGAQDTDSISYYIKQGVALHDQGDYSGAISYYEKALKTDSTHVTALAEKAFSLLLLQEYDESINACKKAINANPGDQGLKTLYTTYANALDAAKKPQEALEAYNEGIALFPDYYHLQFNKGITLAGLQQYNDALLSLQNSAALNPRHASSHNAIGHILMMKNANIPALMAFGRFLILEPHGKRAELNLPMVRKIMAANVEKTGKNKVTINLDPSMLPNEEEENAENNFRTTELILSMTAALDFDKKNKKKTEVELFMGKFETVCASLEELKKDNHGFYWEYYAPYYIEMKKNNFIETFAYIIYASSNDKKTNDWLSKNESKVDLFYEWSSRYKWDK